MPSRSSRSESGSEDEANRGLQTPSSTHHSSRNSPNISTTTTKGHHGDQQVRPIIGGENGSMPLRDPPRSGNNKDNNQKANRDVPPLRVRIGATNLRSASSTIESPDSPGKAASGSRQYETAKRIRARKSVWACDRCYRLKAKCDSGRPTCSSCTKGEFTCSYTARERGLGSGRGRRTITVKAYAQMLETRIKELEVEYYSRRAMARSESRGNKQIPSNPNSNGYLSNEMPNEIRARIPDPRGGIGIHDGFRFPAGGSRQNERNRYIPRGRPPLPPMPHRGRAQRSTEAVWPLFSTDVMNDMVRIYFDTISPQWLLQPGHRRTFTSKPLGRQPSFLVLCIAAQSAPYSEHPEVLAFTAERNIPPYRASAPYYYQARKLLGGCLLDNPSIETSWGLALLGIGMLFPFSFNLVCNSRRDALWI
ncbi:hypothetical protein DFS34DRAFT_636002 [Phlyctochytrium arcticum]|nr:hypothetical protein DFS34DRAFT_636002 [Phlyctochytrium arcticum]